MCGTACNFHSIFIKICICLVNNPRTGEFKYGAYKTYSLSALSDTNFDRSRYLILFNSNQK